MNFLIDQEFRDVLPHKPSDYEKLEKEVLKDGCFTDPFITWNGYLIDGYTRYSIMQAHPDLDFKPYEKKMDDKFADRYAVIVWIASHQESRRNLNDFEWAEVHKKAFDAQKKSVGGDRRSEDFQRSKSTRESKDGRASTKLAQDFGVSVGQFKHSVRIGNAMEEAERLVPGSKEAMKSGAVKSSKSSVEAINDIENEDERKKYVEALVSGEIKKSKHAKQMPPELKGFSKKLLDVVSEMENTDKRYDLDDAIRDLSSAEDVFLNQIEFVLTERSDVIEKDDRGYAQIIGFIDTTIQDLIDMKGRINNGKGSC